MTLHVSEIIWELSALSVLEDLLVCILAFTLSPWPFRQGPHKHLGWHL